MAKLILFNKPYGVLTQFRGEAGDKTLAHFIPIPKVYAAGRLDKDSEGLLVLTDNGQLQHRISHPKHKEWKTYWVQVEGEPSDEALKQLAEGVKLKDGLTLPAKVSRFDPPGIWERDPPIRVRKSIPDTWLELIIREGRNRQVRRMTAAVGHPTLRLIRFQVGEWSVEGIQPGEYKVMEVADPPKPRPSPYRNKRRMEPRSDTPPDSPYKRRKKS